MSWNWIDIVLVLVLLASILAGVIKGFAWQAVRFAFLLFGILLAKAYAAPLGVQLRPLLGSHARPPADKYLAYAIIFLVIYISSLGIAFGIRTAIDKLKLSSFDRLFGGLLGLLKGILFVYAAFLLIAVAKADDAPLAVAMRESQSSRIVSGIDSIVHPLFPQEFHDRIEGWRAKSGRPAPSDVRMEWRAGSASGD